MTFLSNHTSKHNVDAAVLGKLEEFHQYDQEEENFHQQNKYLVYLLNSLSLSERLIKNEANAILSEIDYTRPNKLLTSLQESSKAFLENALKIS